MLQDACVSSMGVKEDEAAKVNAVGDRIRALKAAKAEKPVPVVAKAPASAAATRSKSPASRSASPSKPKVKGS